MKELIIKKIFEHKKNKPLFGQNRPKKGGSYPRPITKRKFNPNWQKFRVGSRVYQVPVKSFRTYLVKLRKGEL
ncbi:MAG: hypothetical protein I3273_06505 [Candidatus Moeniiplasma glomeromycotorum]|nr:hypothetical protein [Candidatus Moeniiplasma glomeromycotorum]MCE8162523.1 hypothetical protein [Candidatus Moeniiplasma glomeromycotorum]MCE8163887.1 hypothetical protein [Candidatus Moeniiplasma glomeromycotorum]MCE8166450.1 hypothetical protein [Candidatus Moeniiplasma glomeromycotorum]MCE8166935.1 hypothetical protein [Candidatus Moeniiplasma glomeromycotorum]